MTWHDHRGCPTCEDGDPCPDHSVDYIGELRERLESTEAELAEARKSSDDLVNLAGRYPAVLRVVEERDEARAEVSRLRTIVATVTAQVKAWRSLPGDALKPYDVLLRLEATLAGKGPGKEVKVKP